MRYISIPLGEGIIQCSISSKFLWRNACKQHWTELECFAGTLCFCKLQELWQLSRRQCTSRQVNDREREGLYIFELHTEFSCISLAIQSWLDSYTSDVMQNAVDWETWDSILKYRISQDHFLSKFKLFLSSQGVIWDLSEKQEFMDRSHAHILPKRLYC